MTGLRKRSVMVSGHATSVSLEQEFWEVLQVIARARDISLNRLVSDVDRTRTGNLSSALRIFVLAELRRAGPDAEDRLPAPDTGPGRHR